MFFYHKAMEEEIITFVIYIIDFIFKTIFKKYFSKYKNNLHFLKINEIKL